jgi:hypothetical protein
MIETPDKLTVEIPPAFYRDADPPPPPPDDPHWYEWEGHDDYEPVPHWLAYGLPVLLVVAATVHFFLIYLVLTATS